MEHCECRRVDDLRLESGEETDWGGPPIQGQGVILDPGGSREHKAQGTRHLTCAFKRTLSE